MRPCGARPAAAKQQQQQQVGAQVLHQWNEFLTFLNQPADNNSEKGEWGVIKRLNQQSAAAVSIKQFYLILLEMLDSVSLFPRINNVVSDAWTRSISMVTALN